MSEPILHEINSWAGCDAALLDLRRLDAERQKLVARRDKELALITAQFAGQLDKIGNLRAACEKAIADFCAAHRDDLGGAKSRQLDNGRIGWKLNPLRVTLLTAAKSWDTALAKVLDAGKMFLHWIRRKPELAKDAILADWNNGKAAAEGLRRFDLAIAGGDESFYIKAEAAPLRDREGEEAAG
jgi:phage host-nuclease inhibitor protein Gam